MTARTKFKMGFALSRPFEHINHSITFEISYCCNSRWASNWFNVYSHVRDSVLIGASLSEPHTSVITLRTCVCMLACLGRPLTINFKGTYSNNSRRSSWSMWGQWRATVECSIRDPKRRQLKLKHAWHWFVLLPTTAGHSQAVVDWVASRVEFQVGGPCINGTHKRQKFRSWFRCKA